MSKGDLPMKKITQTYALTHGPRYRPNNPLETAPSGLRMISAVAIIPLVIAITMLARRSSSLQSRSSSLELSTPGMPALQELHAMVGVNNLVTQEIEDQSLVFPTVQKR
jgi:hypothetical protein